MKYKLVYKFGEFIRNRRIGRHLSDLLLSDQYTKKQLHALQEQRLKELLIHAKENSPFYKHSLDDVDCDNFTLEQLSTLPILTKKILLDNRDQIQNTTDEKMFLSSTSGSTGNSLVFSRNLDWDAAHRAAQLRGYSWFGIFPWMRNLYFWGFNPSGLKKIKVRLLDKLMNRYRVFNYTEDISAKTIQYIKESQYIEGYSSSIYALAQSLKKKHLSFDNIKMVKGTSEKIFDYYQSTIIEVFGKKMVSEYGAAETGIIAFECPEGKMHITMENVIVEVKDDQILVTNLFSFSFPIIRYQLGDYIKLDQTSQCLCGREHDIIDEVTGRIGKKIVGVKHKYPSLMLYYIFKNITLKNDIEIGYAARQIHKGELAISVLCDKHLVDLIKELINKEVNKYFKSDLKIDILFVETLENHGRKAQSFESLIDEEGSIRENT